MNRLATCRPSAHEDYNYDLLPETFTTSDKIPIECHTHGVFYQSIYAHLSGSRCPACAILINAAHNTLTTEGFIRNSRAKFEDRFDYQKTVYVKKDVVLTITCKKHGDITLTPLQHYWSKHGCSSCDVEITKARKFDKLLTKARQIHGDRYDYSQVVYVNAKTKVEIICRRHGSFWQDMYSHAIKATDCPKCAREADKVSKEAFIMKAKLVHGERYGYDKVAFKTLASTVIITCDIHGDFTQRAAAHLAGCKCKKCHTDDTRLSTEDFIKNAKEVHGDSYDYSKVVYRSNKRPVDIICPTHGAFQLRPNSHVSSKTGCRFCCESKGEKAVESCLKKYGIEYIREYRIKPYLYRYDFYLPKLDILIEFNGIQHYQSVAAFGGEQAFTNVKERDAYKKLLAATHGHKLFVLTYLSLSNGTVEKELISRLKRAYARWYKIDGVLRVFKQTSDVYRVFNIPRTTDIKNLDAEVSKVVNEFTVLF